MKKYICPTILIVLLIILSLNIYWPTPKPTPNTIKKQGLIIDYPVVWANAKTAEMIDSWGYPNRSCASYVAYKAWEIFHADVGHWGDGNAWLINAQLHGYTVDNVASKDAIVVYLYPPTHVQWVDRINKDGTIHISQYDQNTGKYNEQDFNPYDTVIFPYGLNFIHLKK